VASARGGGVDPLARAVGAVVEGITFYDLGHIAVADTRVKVTFEDLGRRKRMELSKLEALAGPSAKDAAPRPGFYPVEVVSKLECYVCGHTIETASMPSQCPRCGAARYSFEKEIALARAWEIAAHSARKSASLFRELAGKAEVDTRRVLEELAREEDALASEAEKEIAELRA